MSHPNEPQVYHGDDQPNTFITSGWLGGKALGYQPNEMSMVWVEATLDSKWRICAWMEDGGNPNLFMKCTDPYPYVELFTALNGAWRVLLAVRDVTDVTRFGEICVDVFNMLPMPRPAGLITPFTLPADLKAVVQQENQS